MNFNDSFHVFFGIYIYILHLIKSSPGKVKEDTVMGCNGFKVVYHLHPLAGIVSKLILNTFGEGILVGTGDVDAIIKLNLSTGKTQLIPLVQKLKSGKYNGFDININEDYSLDITSHLFCIYIRSSLCPLDIFSSVSM